MNNIFGRVKSNWKSGITVSFVSIPLSVSLAIAAGSTPVAGINTAIHIASNAFLFIYLTPNKKPPQGSDGSK